MTVTVNIRLFYRALFILFHINYWDLLVNVRSSRGDTLTPGVKRQTSPCDGTTQDGSRCQMWARSEVRMAAVACPITALQYTHPGDWETNHSLKLRRAIVTNWSAGPTFTPLNVSALALETIEHCQTRSRSKSFSSVSEGRGWLLSPPLFSSLIRLIIPLKTKKWPQEGTWRPPPRRLTLYANTLFTMVLRSEASFSP